MVNVAGSLGSYLATLSMSQVFLSVMPRYPSPDILNTSSNCKSNPTPSGLVSSLSERPSTRF